jgi:YegS/Rv2252/BmrU family lipid kinase
MLFMSRKIIYFINPVSGTGNKEKLQRLIREQTSARDIPFEILHTNPQGDYYYLREKINGENITDIVICGGDGTVSQVAGSIIDEPVNIGIIPMGSGNGLALSARIPNNTAKALELIFTGKAAYVDAFYINSTFSCMLCGLGFDAQVAHDFAAQGKRGLLTYVQQTLAHFFSAQPYDFDIVNQGKSFHTSAYFISIANSNQFGNQFTIAPQASLSDGLLDVVVVKKMNKFKLLWEVLKQVRRGQVDEYNELSVQHRNVLYFQTPRLIINNLQGAPLHIDGDPAATARKFSIEVLPQAFKLIQPLKK